MRVGSGSNRIEVELELELEVEAMGVKGEHLLRESLGRLIDLLRWVVFNLGNKGELGL